MINVNTLLFERSHVILLKDILLCLIHLYSKYLIHHFHKILRTFNIDLQALDMKMIGLNSSQ